MTTQTPTPLDRKKKLYNNYNGTRKVEAIFLLNDVTSSIQAFLTELKEKSFLRDNDGEECIEVSDLDKTASKHFGSLVQGDKT